MEVLQDLRERGAQILRRDVRIGPFPEFGDLDIVPVGQVEGGAIAVGGILGGVDVPLPELPDILLRTQDGGDDQLVGIQPLGGKGILEVPADAVQEFRRGRHQERNRMRQFVHAVQVVVHNFHQALLHVLGGVAVLHRRHADSLRDRQLHFVQIVELLGEIHVPDADGMVLDGAGMAPAPVLDLVHRPGDEKAEEEGENGRYDEPELGFPLEFHRLKIRRIAQTTE